MVIIRKNAAVSSGPQCPGSIMADGQRRECDKRAIFVVENRRMYKCAYGHRWPVPTEDLAEDPLGAGGGA